MRKSLFNKIILWCVILFLLILAPTSLDMPSQSVVRAICTGLAIDTSKESGKLEVTAQILIPEAGGQYTQKLSLVSYDAKSLEESLEMMEYQVGKKIRMEHCCFIILSNAVCERNITTILDYLVRGNNIGNNTLLIHTDGKSKDLLSATSNVNSSEVDNLQVISEYNEKYLFAGGANLLSFYHDYLSPHKTSYMANITMIKDDKSGGNGGTDQSSGSGSGSGSESSQGSSSSDKGNTQEDVVTSDGSVAIFYKGKCARVVTSEEREDFNWLDPKVEKAMVQIENVSDNILKNATISYTIERKKMTHKFEIVNNVPTIRINFDLGLQTEMVLQGDESSLPIFDDYINDAVTLAFAEKIDRAVKNSMNIQKEHGFDVFDYYKEFSINCNADWKKYLSSLENPDDYMKGIEIFTEVTCYSAF